MRFRKGKEVFVLTVGSVHPSYSQQLSGLEEHKQPFCSILVIL